MSLAELVDAEAPTWRRHAACRGIDPSIFFPESRAAAAYDEARAICSVCAVRRECLADHLGEKDGCWGGTSPPERKALRRRERAGRAGGPLSFARSVSDGASG